MAAAGLKPPTSYEDLTKPEWRGKFSIDPVTDDVFKDLEKSQGRAKVRNLMKRLGERVLR